MQLMSYENAPTGGNAVGGVGVLKGRLRLLVQNAEQVQGDDRDDRYAEQPKKNVAPHSVLAVRLQYAEEMHQDDSADRHADKPENDAATHFQLQGF